MTAVCLPGDGLFSNHSKPIWLTHYQSTPYFTSRPFCRLGCILLSSAIMDMSVCVTGHASAGKGQPADVDISSKAPIFCYLLYHASINKICQRFCQCTLVLLLTPNHLLTNRLLDLYNIMRSCIFWWKMNFFRCPDKHHASLYENGVLASLKTDTYPLVWRPQETLLSHLRDGTTASATNQHSTNCKR